MFSFFKIKELIHNIRRRYFFRGYKATIVAAMDSKMCGLGFEGTMSWHVRSDMKHFKTLTSKKKNSNIRNVLVCGRKTFESIGSMNLPDRHMIILSNNPLDIIAKTYENVDLNDKFHRSDIFLFLNKDKTMTIFIKTVNCMRIALDVINEHQYGIGKIFIIGGGKIYKLFLSEKIPDLTIKDCVLTNIDTEAAQSLKTRFSNRYDTYFPITLVAKSFSIKKIKNIEPGIDIHYYIRDK